MVSCVLEYSSVHTVVVPSSNNTSFGVLMPRFFKKFVCTVLWTRGQGTRTFSGNFPGHVDRGPARFGYARLIREKTAYRKAESQTSWPDGTWLVVGGGDRG